MKKLLILLLLVSNGCAYLTSTTTDGTKVTRMRCYTIFDSQSGLTKFRNSNGGDKTNSYTAGTTIGQLNQETSSTNLNQLLEIIVSGAVSGVVKGMK